jgi:hypothetical protein
MRTTLDDLFGIEPGISEDADTAEPAEAEALSVTEYEDEAAADLDDRTPMDEATSDEDPESDEVDLTALAESDEIRDLVLAEEGSNVEMVGREVTGPPSDADQDETARIVTEAVEAGATPQEIEANPPGLRDVPAPHQKSSSSADVAEGRDAEMNQP